MAYSYWWHFEDGQSGKCNVHKIMVAGNDKFRSSTSIAFHSNGICENRCGETNDLNGEGSGEVSSL